MYRILKINFLNNNNTLLHLFSAFLDTQIINEYEYTYEYEYIENDVVH